MAFRLIKIVLLSVLLGNQIHAGELVTPLEKSGFAELTSHSQMMQYLQELEDLSPLVSVKVIGKTVEGREIPALFFSSGKVGDKPIVLISCQQHGDEPSGKEAALLLASKLVSSQKSFLEKMDILMVPQANPDGAEKNKRRNANGTDLNRNHVILSEPESFALHSLFLEWMPQVTLDVHEYQSVDKDWIAAGYLKDADEMMGTVTNLNIDQRLRQFSHDIILPETGKRIEENGFRFHRYIVGSPFNGERVRFSTTAINDARQSMGILNTLSFIIEGKRYGNVLNLLEQRVKGQIAGITAFLQTVEAHLDEIIPMIAAARNHNTLQQKESILQMDYFPDPAWETLLFPVFDIATWTHTDRELTSFAPQVMAKMSVPLPVAYLVPSSEMELIHILKRHRIPLYHAKAQCTAPVEIYTVKHVTPGEDEDKPALNIDLTKSQENQTILPGDFIIPLNNRSAILIPLLLEPQSSWGLVTNRGAGQYRFSGFVQPGKKYPVMRLMSLNGIALVNSADSQN